MIKKKLQPSETVRDVVRPKIIVMGTVKQIGTEGDKKVYLIKPYRNSLSKLIEEMAENAEKQRSNSQT